MEHLTHTTYMYSEDRKDCCTNHDEDTYNVYNDRIWQIATHIMTKTGPKQKAYVTMKHKPENTGIQTQNM